MFQAEGGEREREKREERGLGTRKTYRKEGVQMQVRVKKNRWK